MGKGMLSENKQENTGLLKLTGLKWKFSALDIFIPSSFS